jgi:hypothetical protein
MGVCITLSYAAFSTYIIFSNPLTFAASSAIALIPLPAMKPVTEPPNFCAAVTADRDEILSFPSLCSSTANDDNNLARAERWGTVVEWDGLRQVLACRIAVDRAIEYMVTVI